MASRVTFGAPTSISHRPDPEYRPPEHYAGLVNPALTLKTTSGGYTVEWGWSQAYKEWVHPELPMTRIYLSDGVYECWQGNVLTERGTWKAVA